MCRFVQLTPSRSQARQAALLRVVPDRRLLDVVSSRAVSVPVVSVERRADLFRPVLARVGSWSVGGLLYVSERILREVRSRHRTYLSKVVVHPGKTVELQIKKEKTMMRAGQYIMLNCPAVSLWQWHPFTLTSAPEEDHLSIHFRTYRLNPWRGLVSSEEARSADLKAGDPLHRGCWRLDAGAG